MAVTDWATKSPGSGSGYGLGDGSGYGLGLGSGYGYGLGDGSGYGLGDGSGSGYGLLTQAFADHPRVTNATADGSQVTLALWRSDADGRPANGGSGEPVQPGMVQEIPGPLRICSNGLHGDSDPSQWSGDRWWVVALFEPVQRQGTKVASLKRLIVEELA